MGKLPYIPDKRLYAAVMGACSWIRESGYFNKATEYYAEKYDVPLDDVQRYVRMAQANGQRKAAKNNKPRKYLWFAVEYSMGNERNGCCYFEPLEAQYCIKKGLSARTVQNSLSAHDDLASEYAPLHWFGRTEGFETKLEAVETVEKWRNERGL